MNGNRVVQSLTRPRCMTVDEWQCWSASNSNAGGNKAKSPCHDCLPEWRAVRVADHTCEQPPNQETAR